MKFLFIAPRYSGGIGGHASMLADQLAGLGHDVTKMNIPHIPIKNLKNPSFTVFSTLKGISNREQYDVVHAFNIPSAFAMKHIKSNKKVLSIHGIFSDQVKTLHSSGISLIASKVEAKVVKWADKLTTDSKISQLEYKKKLNLDFEYLPSPIDTKLFDKIPNIEKNRNQIIFIGRDSFEKGIDILKNIEPKINGKVIYATNMPWLETMKMLKSSSILVVPSRMESLPTVIKEAFYLKIPVIATSVGGIPELITNNENGVLVSSQNSKKLLETINELLSNPEKIDKLIQNGHNFVKNNMTWDIMLPKYIKFYENLLNS